MTKRERLLEKIKAKIANAKWTDKGLVSFAILALNCDECPAFETCDCECSCFVTVFDWLSAHGDEEVEE